MVKVVLELFGRQDKVFHLRLLYYHPDSLPSFTATFDSAFSTPLSLIVNLTWLYAWCGESTIIASLSCPNFRRKILYVQAWPMILPPAALTEGFSKVLSGVVWTWFVS